MSNTEGFFTISGEEYPCQLLNLPGVVESYKTYNDVNLVKSSDIGQVGGTAPESPACLQPACCGHPGRRWMEMEIDDPAMRQVILVRDIGTPPVFGLDFSNGVTPPMR